MPPAVARPNSDQLRPWPGFPLTSTHKDAQMTITYTRLHHFDAGDLQAATIEWTDCEGQFQQFSVVREDKQAAIETRGMTFAIAKDGTRKITGMYNGDLAPPKNVTPASLSKCGSITGMFGDMDVQVIAEVLEAIELAVGKLRLSAYHRGFVLARLHEARRELTEFLVWEARLDEIERQVEMASLRRCDDKTLGKEAENLRQRWSDHRTKPFRQGATVEEDSRVLGFLRHHHSNLMLVEAEIARRAALSAHQRIEEFALRAAGKSVPA